MIGHKHGGEAAGSTAPGGFVPVQTRDARFRSTVVDEFPAVTGRELEWKLSPVGAFGDLLDGPLDGSRYPLEDPDGVTEWVARADANVGLGGLPEDRAAANAWSQTSEVLEVRIAGEHPEPIHLDRHGLGDAPRAAHTIITAAPHSRAIVVLGSTGPAHLTENVEILVGDGANLTVVVVHEWDDDAVQLAAHHVVVGRDAAFRHIIVSLGGAVVRVNPTARLAGDGADAQLLGLYFADAGQHIEHQVFLHHEAKHTKGRVTYKGALQGQGARTVWIGDTLIGPDATGTDSYEQNRNLVLTEGTRADSIPNLEIETGDILGAGHASATGRFDDEQLFYLQSRGIAEEAARRLVVRGFFHEILVKIDVPEVRERLEAAIEAELEAVGA